MTFADFIEVDQNSITFEEVEFELDSSSSSTISDEVDGQEELPTQETECDLVPDSEALEALATSINHCSQSGEIVPGVSEALHRYREKVIIDYLRSKRLADIRTFFSKPSV